MTPLAMRRCTLVLSFAVLFLVLSSAGRAQAALPDTSLAQRLLDAEDRRAPDAVSLRLLMETALRGVGPERLVAIRALGRLERPLLADSLMPLLRDTIVAVRAVTAHAVGQLVAPAAIGTMDSIGGARVVADVAARLGQFLQYAETDGDVQGALATSVGRAAYASAAQRQVAQSVLLTRVGGDRAAAVGALRGLDWLWRGKGVAAADAASAVRRVASTTADSAVRRWAMQALVSGRAMDTVTAAVAMRDGDPQVRRLGVLGLAAAPDSAGGAARVLRAMDDSAYLVRVDAARAVARRPDGAACAALVRAMRDVHSHVALTAIDVVPAPCAGVAVPVLDSLARALGPGAARDPMHRAAHALVTLAALDASRARAALPAAMAHRAWIVRVYAARAVARLREAPAALTLAADGDDNVREAALAALIAMDGARTDSVAVAALARGDYQLVLNAAEWLRAKGQASAAALPAMTALERISRDRRDTSRDPRLALVRLIAKGGSDALAARLMPFVRDFDPVIAGEAARTVSAWTGRAVAASPRPLAAPTLRVRDAESLRGALLRITMALEAGGGVIDVALDPATAPGTVVRVARLARAGHYSGRTLHRVVPTFVLQGGSPGANEYMGDGPYLRDEVGPAVHARGTLGISTRGRDTGDAQLFVNLADNARLDFQYTVFGRVVRGMTVADQVLEGDVMARVEVVRR
ncbi:MAG: peptidylprolyl isomerase [Gemmatimonadaceae bacterium]|jgi:cyclophilin family peptidyl-prolyl cis-trans isomerase/HEAT repeat protein|nr:peptidylprolyl isomerase [Gemmatimonadaceae bacterium]